MAKLPRITGRETVRFLESEGFNVVRIRGSHHFMQCEELRTTVPVHGNRNLKVGTLRSILRDIEMAPAEFAEKLKRS